MRQLRWLLMSALLLVTGLTMAVEDIPLIDTANEPRFNELSNVLRCMVCQNQTIADSNADLARDFRNQVKEKINEGQTNDEIIDFMVSRYGDYILYRPPFNLATALLWVGPFVLVIFGFVFVFRLLKREQPTDEEGSDQQQDKLKALLKEEDEA